MIKTKENYIKLNGEYIKILPDEEDKRFLEFKNPLAMEEVMKLEMKNPETIQLNLPINKKATLVEYVPIISFISILIYLIFNYL